MSRVLQVSRSGFYAWRRRQDSPPQQKDRKQLDEAVKKAFEARKGRSGSPRLKLDLADAGHWHDRKTIAESMRRQGLRAKAAKKCKATTNSRHNLPVAPNRLPQDFTATAPNQKYVGDITYLWTHEGWLYLAVIIDRVLTTCGGLGHVGSNDRTAGLRCVTDGLVAAPTAHRGHSTFGPGQPVLFRGLPAVNQEARPALQHESEGKLLR